MSHADAARVPPDFVALLREARAQVEGSPLYRKFIDGTPLENDIAVWMATFAVEVRQDALAHADAEIARLAQAQGWQPIATAPKDREVLLLVKLRAGIPGKMLVGHYMPGGHCIEDHPPIDRGWYFWNGCMFDRASEPTHWQPLPPPPSGQEQE